MKGAASETDSLEKVLITTPDKEAKLKILNKLAKEFSSVSFEKSIQYGTQALELSRKLKQSEEEANAMISIGEAYIAQNKFTEAEKYFKDAKDLCEKSGNKNGIAKSLNGIGLIYYLQGNSDEAIKHYNLSLIYSKNNKIKAEQGNALFNIGQVFRKRQDYGKAELNFKQALKVFESINDIDGFNGLAKTYNGLGMMKQGTGDYKSAIEYYEKALQYREIKGDKKGCAILYNNIGNTYLKWGEYEKAIGYYQKALKIFEEIGSQNGIASCATNIGLVYEYLASEGNYKQNILYHTKALEYQEKGLKIWENLGNDLEMAKTYNNIGNIYGKQISERIISKYGVDWEKSVPEKERHGVTKEYTQAIDYYKKSLALCEKIGFKQGLANSYSNLGQMYSSTWDYNNALSFYERALKLNREIDNKYEVALTLFNSALIYYNLNNYSKALEYISNCLDIALKFGQRETAKSAYFTLSNIHFALGDYKNSLHDYKKYTEIKDSVSSENTIKVIQEINTRYETERKEKDNQILKKDNEIQQTKNKQLKFGIYGTVLILLLISVLLLMIFKQSVERKRINVELANKNDLITEQKKEITDSIHYASLIQTAVMPAQSYLEQFLPGSFIYFHPRDIVSGDFYWINEKAGKLVIAAADCTGHGVPGAFMSMMGIALLNSTVLESEDLHADEILNELRFQIIDSLHQTGRAGENKDGMDLALYILDHSNLTLEFAGANNPLYIVRNNELIETKADRMPIGIHERANIPFTKHEIALQKGDMIYSFSDGYHDQFGGENNKKFLSANFKKLLLRIYTESASVQSKVLDETIKEWMKNTYQVDDMLVIGVKV
jgi:tetratricopeptide (TPR) repeat protein